MTSKQVPVALALLFAGVLLAGCSLFSHEDRIVAPHADRSPYPATKVWAVAPFRNESGTSVVDGIRMAEQLAGQLHQVRGIQVLPVNRVIAAMEASNMTQVTTVDQVRRLLQTLQVDGLIVGSITAWEPYDPPKIGVSIALYSAPGSLELQTAAANAPAGTTTGPLPGEQRWLEPVAQVGSLFDAANGSVLLHLKEYATGRAPSDSPAGWRRYLLSMDLYSEFVSHELMRRLFASEWQRLTGNVELGSRNSEPGSSPDASTTDSPRPAIRVPRSELTQ